MTGYTRQNDADIQPGQPANAGPLKNEFDTLQAAFNATTGHAHDGTLGDAPKISLTAAVSGTLPVASGGTGSSTAAAARSALGLVIGTDVEAEDAGLTSIAGLTTAADKLIYTTASDVYATSTLTSFGRSLIDDASASAARSTLGLGTIATQANTAVNIDGGTVDGTVIGGSTKAAGSFNALVASTAVLSGILSVDNTTDRPSTVTGSIQTDGGLGVAKALFVGGSILAKNGLATSPSYSFITDSDTGIYRISGGRIGFATNSALAMQIDATTGTTFVKQVAVNSTTDSTSTLTGAIQTAGGLGVVKTIVVGTGIKLGGTAASNLLSVYEEGPWTPTIQDGSLSDAEGQTYFIQQGEYVRVGKQVTICGKVQINSLGSLSGVVRVANLPFPLGAGQPPASIVFGSGSSLVLPDIGGLTGIIQGTSSIIEINRWTTSGTTNLTPAELSTSGLINFSGTYFVD